ncbi:hypothetical protein K469DRAFT_689112 [Zopfia rhizophila CBS 207.26]|uniref:Uncharacterized protein n=1 Tax=Zopfia rhizophila CBS 207.26 TaxID=1314779 RepID=A0A6A6ETD3_9PEZI|nr:hypothetical protein K469DRAFT_689112 [Zopfia rhizophila CBS 207.26]
MSGPSTTRPSNKGYSPVPVEERIDDGVDSPQREEADAEDDEGLYNTSAPLLSSRTRGNEPPRPQGELCWYHKIGRWRPFRRRNSYYTSWDPPSKKRNWRKIFLLSFLGFLIAAITGLSISTGVLATKYRHARNRSCWNYRPYRQYTHLPLNEEWRSANNRLNFVEVYPPIKSSPSSACQAAWNTLHYVPCHEKIWNRSWDNGKHSSLFDPDISLYARALCDSTCTQAINRAYQLISSQCTEQDVFDMTNYIGPFSADAGLEDGPVAVITTIANRLTHTCRQEPTGQRSYYDMPPYCAAVMWEDWFIVDGMNAGNLEGLETFEARTHTTRTQRGTYMSSRSQNDCDNVSNYYRGRWVSSKRFGPDVNSTSCGWCTMNWFERKLLSWKKKEIVDPKTGKHVSLPDYLRRIKHAGQRCDADAWDRVWGRAIRKYKSSGELPDDWEDDGKDRAGKKPEKPSKPCKPCEDDNIDGIARILPIIPGDPK